MTCPVELPQEIIARKRDRFSLSENQIQQFVSGVVDGSFKDYQASALLMAILLNGMSTEEAAYLTVAMLKSGRIVELPDWGRPKVDKHSTGGVGDKVSLILAPLAAAVGVTVPMMSGRGLGHTGGTLDKLESIPGFSVDMDEARYREQLESIHVAMIGQSADMVPADRKLYALRDVTGTVESVPLICASILSKKLAEGIDSLVLDVKCGSGAFMKTESDARELAESLIAISQGLGKPASALLTRMDQPLGRAVGNSIEVIEAIECLKGNGPEDLMEVSVALVIEMMRIGGLEADAERAKKKVTAAVADGTALSVFRDLIEAQGGNCDVIEDSMLFPQPKAERKVLYQGKTRAFVSELDALRVGEAARLLGAGRSHAEAELDLSVGVYLHKKVGESVEPGDLLATLHVSERSSVESAVERLEAAFAFSQSPFIPPSVIIESLFSK